MKTYIKILPFTLVLSSFSEAKKELSLYSLKGQTSYIFASTPRYSPELGYVCLRNRSLKIEIPPGSNQFRMSYFVENFKRGPIQCEHGMPRERVIEGVFSSKADGGSSSHTDFEIELLSLREGKTEAFVEDLPIGRTLGYLYVSPKRVSPGVSEASLSMRLFGGLYSKGVKVQYFESGEYQLDVNDEVFNIQEVELR